MAPTFEPSTPVAHNSAFTAQNFVTPHKDTVSSYSEDTPVDKSDMSFPTVVKPGPFGLPQQLPVAPVGDADVTMRGGVDEDSQSPNPKNMEAANISNDLGTTTRLTPAEFASIQKEWLGTSQLLNDTNIEMQLTGGLDSVIMCLKIGFKQMADFPYDPIVYIQMASALNKIGFCDVGAGYAYRAIILIKAGLGIDTVATIPNLKDFVVKAMEMRLKVSSAIIVEDELKAFLGEAYISLLDGLMGSAAYWDGLNVINEASRYCPSDPDITEMNGTLTNAFLQQSTFLSSQGVSGNELRALSRTGRVYCKQYPWLAKELFYRTPALIKQINKNFGSGNCEVRPVVFGQHANLGPKKVKEGEDVGPCGVFATRDIQAGEFIMVDKTLLGISDIPASRLRHCEACHAAVFPPYLIRPEEFVPFCCRKVAYCSQACAENATKGYHKILCGNDFEWVYQIPGLKGDKGLSSGWRPVIFLRTVAILLADKTNGIYLGHPLQHPLLARLGANYTPPAEDKLQSKTIHDWQFAENVVAPTRILLELGVNIFTTLEWTPEVVQTITFREDNNANMATVTPEPGKKSIDMINVNPQYIFFNHSCHPNVSWHSALPNSDIGVTNIMDEYGNVHRPGESTVFCDAARDIKKDEQLFISYIGDPLGSESNEEKLEKSRGDRRYLGRGGKRLWLGKWFEDGCGCETCERENVEREALEFRVKEEVAAVGRDGGGREMEVGEGMKI